MAKRVLLTGHGGFVGHHCLEYFLQHTDWEFICIDSFRHKGTCRRVVEVLNDNSRVKTFRHNLAEPFSTPLQNLIFDRQIDGSGVITEKPIHYIINIASESAVERSTVDPVSCLRNNFDLVINMLEFAKTCKSLELFLHLSTDEVYGEAAPGHFHEEWSSILPSNPYAASKAAQEAVCIAYWRTYNLPIVLVNTMNILGERQDPEKFLPKLIQKVALGETMPIYGEEGNIGSRIYLDAKTLADAIIFLTKRTPSRYNNMAKNQTGDFRPDRYHVCGEKEIDNLTFGKLVAEIMQKPFNYVLIPSESARPGYDRRYALNGDKIRKLGWNPPFEFEESLHRIVNWTTQNAHWIIK